MSSFSFLFRGVQRGYFSFQRERSEILKVDELLISAKEFPWQKPISLCSITAHIYANARRKISACATSLNVRSGTTPSRRHPTPYIHRPSGLAQIAVSALLRISSADARKLSQRSTADTALEILHQSRVPHLHRNRKMSCYWIIRFTVVECVS